MSKHLPEPVEIGGIKLINRVALAPMTRTRATSDGTPTDLMAEYYAQRASAGLVIAEATGVDVSAIAWMGMPGAYRVDHLAGWKKSPMRCMLKAAPFFCRSGGRDVPHTVC